MHELLNKLIAGLFPRICLVCRTDISPVNFKFHICPACLVKTKTLNPMWGEKFHPLDGFFAAGEFSSPLREILILFKYHGKDYLTPLLVDFWLNRWQGPNPEYFDGIIPIPMPYWRETFRGYNQAGLLAEELGRRWKKPIFKNFLKRKFYSRSQINLGRKSRIKNADLSFYFRKFIGMRHLPKRILLLDDICTTGATLKACAKLLKNEGVEFVFGSAVAREIIRQN